MLSVITVSNGSEFFQISKEDLADAQRDGFYRPAERGRTIVGNNGQLFEIPISDVDAAKAEGFRDLLETERTSPASRRPLPLRRSPSGGPVAAAAAANPVDDLLLDGLTQSEIEAEQARLEAEQELAETEGWRWYVLFARMWIQARRQTLLGYLRGSGVSLAVHVALFLILASLILATKEKPKGLLMSSAPARDMVEEVVIEPQPLDITEPTETTSTDSPPEAEEVAMNMTESVVAPNFMAAVSGDAVKAPAMPSKTPGKGKVMASKTSFFGSKSSATNYVFVIDNSNSMTNGRFETALNELMIAVNRLTPKQKFYVIFYSDTAYPMMHPNAVSELQPATTRNKELLYYWLQSVQLCLKTNGTEAIQMAFNLKPDIIYVLGDGGFTDGAARRFASMPQRKIPLHTLGMEVKERDAAAFREMAVKNGGTYKDVGVARGALEMWRQNPRPRNSVRGQVWGLMLKPAPKL